MILRRRRGRHRASPIGCAVVFLLTLPGWANAAAAGGTPGAESSPTVEYSKGKEVYQMYCSTCHGLSGEGNGPIAAGLTPRPTDFTDRAVMARLTDAEVTEFITQGGGPTHNCPTMPSWAPILRPEDVTSVVAYVRTLARK